MLIHRIASVAFVLCTAFITHSAEAQDHASLVNPLIGTESRFDFSNGNTSPLVVAPFGMTAWTPRTGESTGWIYQYSADTLYGFQATHQASPWIGDYGHFSVMPFVNEVAGPDGPVSKFSHKTEESHPYHYQVLLQDSGIEAEMTATTRCSSWRFRFPRNKRAFIQFDLYGSGEAEVLQDASEVHGVARANHGGVAGDFGCRFVARIGCPIVGVSRLTLGDKGLKGKTKRVILELDVSDRPVVEMTIGTSFISEEQATTNLDREIGKHGFEESVHLAKNEWNQRLSVIEIEGATKDQLVTFYSCLYRALVYPRIFYEETSDRQLIHYSPYTGRIEPGELYTDNGFWDTFRAVYPLFSIIDPDLNASMIRGWINAYREGGWFPKWASPGYRDCMIGTHVESLIADALCKDIRDFDLNDALAACLKDAMQSSDDGSVGRKGLTAYLELGYVPCEEVPEATARTLEYAYDDWCVAQVAKELSRHELVPKLLERSETFRNVYDPEVGFMRGRLRDGSWRAPFSPDEWGGPFTEGGSWHYSWSVLHDVKALIELMGGDETFQSKLDAMLEAEPTFGIGTYPYEIHEMTEMVAGKMGQYAHGNQPVHHVLYLYNFAGAPWKAAKPIRQVVDTLYGPGPDGYCGDEDNGQMSAWYLFSTLGFYPVCPGKPGYVIGSPRFEKATINLPSGKQLIISAKDNSADKPFVAAVTLNGKQLSRSWITHQEIAAGSVLEFAMSEEPNKVWGTEQESRPFPKSIGMQIQKAED